MNIKEFAQAYEPSQLGNIAELDRVQTTVEITSEVRKNKDNEEYHVNFIVHEGREYRVPPSVIEQLKSVLEDNPNIPAFKVKKTGEGMGTKYQVIPLMQ